MRPYMKDELLTTTQVRNRFKYPRGYSDWRVGKCQFVLCQLAALLVSYFKAAKDPISSWNSSTALTMPTGSPWNIDDYYTFEHRYVSYGAAACCVHVHFSICSMHQLQRATSNIGVPYQCMPLFVGDDKKGKSDVAIKGILFADFDCTVTQVTCVTTHMFTWSARHATNAHPAHTLQLHTFNVMYEWEMEPKDFKTHEVWAYRCVSHYLVARAFTNVITSNIFSFCRWWHCLVALNEWPD